MTDPHLAEPPVRHPLPSTLLHDLRTPLNQIIGYSELLMEEVGGEVGEGILSRLAKVRAAGYQLLSLLDDNFLPIRSLDASGSTAPETSGHDVRVLLEEGEEEGSASYADRSARVEGTLLVVDDIEANRDILSRRLAKEGYEVETAEDGVRALQMLRAGNFDLVLLDIMMPEMDGYEVLTRLNEDELLRHIPIIMVSAISEVDSVARCIQMGADDYLTKPFNSILLKARVGACLTKKRARDRELQLLEQLRQSYERLEELQRSIDDGHPIEPRGR